MLYAFYLGCLQTNTTRNRFDDANWERITRCRIDDKIEASMAICISHTDSWYLVAQGDATVVLIKFPGLRMCKFNHDR